MVSQGENPKIAPVKRYARTIRPILFATGLEDFRFATHGGTLFLIDRDRRVFGFTCQHAIKDFALRHMCVPAIRLWNKATPFATIKVIGKVSGGAGVTYEGSEIDDVLIIEFENPPEFFDGEAFKLDVSTIWIGNPGDAVVIFGCPKKDIHIDPLQINTMTYGFELCDVGVFRADPTLRVAKGRFPYPGFDNLAGFSGAPVFNLSAEALTGMVIRAGLNGDQSIVYYLSVLHLMKILEGAVNRAAKIDY